MNTLIDTARSASFRDGKIVVVFESGVEIGFPVVLHKPGDIRHCRED